MMISDQRIMLKCHKWRRQGREWKIIREELGIKPDRHASLVSTYSKWKNKHKVARKRENAKPMIDEDDFADMVNMMANAFKEVTVEASFNMQIPKRLIDIQASLLEEIKATRIAMEKIVDFGKKIDELDKNTRTLLDANMPLNRKRR